LAGSISSHHSGMRRAVSVSQWSLANTRYKRYPLLEKPPEGGFFANAFV